MKTKFHFALRASHFALAVAFLSTLNSQLSTLHAQGTAFTYQGRLVNSGTAANGFYSFQFLLRQTSNGAQQGPTLTNNAVAVSNGLFTTTLDFGDYFGEREFALEIGVRTNGSAGPFTILAPTQVIRPTPLSIAANHAAVASTANMVPESALPASVVRLDANSQVSVLGDIRSTNTTFYSQGFESVTFPPGGWSSGGDANWTRTTTVFHEGSAAAASGAVTHNQSSYLEIGYNFPSAGLVKFNWKVSSEAGFDFLQFCLDNACTLGSNYNQRISGEVDWTEVAVPVSAGAHSFRWLYGKDINVNTAADKGWIDNVRFTDAYGNLFAAGNLVAGSANIERNVGVGGNISIEGNVGIGTNNPANRLSVAGGADFTGNVMLGGDLSVGRSVGIGADAYIGGSASFGAQTRQMLNLYDTIYGIGVQNTRLYFRTAYGPDDGFAWFHSGTHSDTPDDPGVGGQRLMTLTLNGLVVSGAGNGVQGNSANAGASGVYGENTGNGFGVAGRTGGGGSAVFGDNTDPSGWAGNFNGNVSVAGNQHFGTQIRQMLNLWGTQYGIGVQNNNLYFRTDNVLNGAFRWYKGGVHSDTSADPGGGTNLMTLNGLGLFVQGTFVSGSDRNTKENFHTIDSRAVLEKVAAMPVSEWNYKHDPSSRHVGPMAQDFRAAFGLGHDDKGIATIDADGVALAAIQGLNQKVEEKDARIAELERRLEKLEQRMNHRNGGVK